MPQGRCTVITLLTDFGLRDPFVGVMKGVILRRFPQAVLVDLTHEIQPQNVAEASFWLARSYHWFARGTVHVAVVDPTVGSDRAGIVVDADGHLLVGPDNGILEGVVRRHAHARVREIDRLRCGLRPPSHTFHGRDVFAPVAAELAAGRLALDNVGAERASIATLPTGTTPTTEAARLRGTVVTVDRFGNLITDIDQALIGDRAKPRIMVGDTVLPVKRTYAEGEHGELMALINAFGTLEIACRNGSAAATLGLTRGARVVVDWP